MRRPLRLSETLSRSRGPAGSSRSSSPRHPSLRPWASGSSASGGGSGSSRSSASRDPEPASAGLRETVMNGDRLCTEVSRLRWGRPTWAIPVLLFLAVLLVAGLAFNLANLDTGGESFPGPSTGGTQPTAVGSVDPFLRDLFLVVFGGLLVSAVGDWMVHPPRPTWGPSKTLPWWAIPSPLLALWFGISVLFLSPGVAHHQQV